MKIGPQNVHFLEQKFSRCAETMRNSGKTKTTAITTLSRLPSRPCLVKFGLDAFEL